MNPFGSDYIDIPKPKKPGKLDRLKFSYRLQGDENKTTSDNMQKKVNYLMEMLKFFPEYEKKKLQGIGGKEYDDSLKEYGYEEDAEGNITPLFGEVYQCGTETEFARSGHLREIDELQIANEAAGDFNHYNIEEGEDEILTPSEINDPITPGLDSDTWKEVVTDLDTVKESYYDLMKKGIGDISDKRAFSIMISMLESRNRGMSVFKEIFGDPTKRASKRFVNFKDWNKDIKDDLKPWKLGFLSFFLDIEQSYFNRINPMFGKSTNGIVSESDKLASQNFFGDLTTKVESYINTLSGDKKTQAQTLWNNWKNPTDIPETTTKDFREDWANQQIIKILDKDFDKLVVQNITINALNRTKAKKYKEDKQKYEEELDERMWEDLQTKKAQKKRTAEVKKTLNKIKIKDKKNKALLKKYSNKSLKYNKLANRSAMSKLTKLGKINKAGAAKAARRAIKSPLAKKLAVRRVSSLRTTGKILKTAPIKHIKASRQRIRKASKTSVVKRKSIAKAVHKRKHTPVTKHKRSKRKKA